MFRWIDSNGPSLTSPPTTWPLPARIRRRRRTSGGVETVGNPLRTDLSFTSTITTSSSSSPARLDLASSHPSSLAASAATSPTASTSSNSTSPRVLDMDHISPGRTLDQATNLDSSIPLITLDTDSNIDSNSNNSSITH